MKPLSFVLPALLLAAGISQSAPLDMKALSSVLLAGAEISAFDPVSKRLFVTASTGLQIIDFSDPSAPSLISTIDLTTHGLAATDVTSVAVHGGTVAVAPTWS